MYIVCVVSIHVYNVYYIVCVVSIHMYNVDCIVCVVSVRRRVTMHLCSSEHITFYTEYTLPDNMECGRFNGVREKANKIFIK